MKITLKEVKELPVYKALLKTGKFHKAKLARELRKAIQATKMKQKYSIHANSVWCLFDWDESPQGCGYWASVNDIQRNFTFKRHLDLNCITTKYRKELDKAYA